MSQQAVPRSPSDHDAVNPRRAVSAWQLVGLTLRYHIRLITIGCGLVVLATAAILAITVLVDRQDVTVVFFLASALLVAGSMTLAILINANESSERRLLLLLLLPTRRSTVYWARFLSPLVVHCCGIAIGLLLITLERVSGVAGPVPRPYHALGFMASVTGFYIYFPTLFPDLGLLWRGGRRPQAAVVAGTIALGFALLAWLQLSGVWKSPVFAWLMPLPALACAALSLYMFRHRPSFAVLSGAELRRRPTVTARDGVAPSRRSSSTQSMTSTAAAKTS